ncbi:hypothetical protein LTR22_027664 [Elasticomyces elasticus]|nr:hypothetical protein LTR22_027664 [Elasticomyces elasticus]
MAAELQLVSTVFDLSKLAWSAGLFLKYASKADYTAIEVLERVERLRHVTEGVNLVLQSRHKADVPLADKGESFIEAKIQESLTACIEFLQDLEQRVEGFEVSDVPVKVLVTRFKVAWRHKSMSQGQSDLEARISILQINLIILQLFDQCQTHSTIGANHSELFELIAELDKQVLHGNGLLKLILGRFGQDPTAIPAAPLTDVTLIPDLQAETGAVSSLRDCLHAAEHIHEQYTSDYVPEDRLSQAIATSRPLSPCSRVDMAESESATPIPKTVSATLSQSSMPVDSVSRIKTRVLPLRTLDRYIADHRERARAETERSHFNQAETCLESAAHYSEAREHQYGIPFAEKIEIGEELANIYQQQGRWAEAVSKFNELMREDSQGIDDAAVLANARHNQLLASVYFDRHMHSTSNTPQTGSDDLEVAEKHAHVAFAKRDSILERGEGAPGLIEEIGRHYKCMQLLVSILEARGKLVEANVWREMLVEGSASGLVSTSTSRTLPVEPGKERHEALVLAIKSNDMDLLHTQTAFQDLNLEKVLGRGGGKTLLMHAVEYSDESIVEKLLDPAVGATVDMRDRKGQTSLHLAAALGRHNMVRCLLHHDADIEAKDNDGETPIVKAVKGGHRDIVQDLLDRGANATTKNLVRLNEFGLLHHATFSPTTRMINLLLDLVPELADSVDQAGRTSLHLCAQAEKVEHAKALLEHKHHLDIDALDAASRTPLYFAASKPATSKHRLAMVDLLVFHGASVDDAKLPTRMREYAALKTVVVPRRGSRLSRHDGFSTSSSDSGYKSLSGSESKLSRIISHFHSGGNRNIGTVSPGRWKLSPTISHAQSAGDLDIGALLNPTKYFTELDNLQTGVIDRCMVTSIFPKPVDGIIVIDDIRTSTELASSFKHSSNVSNATSVPVGSVYDKYRFVLNGALGALRFLQGQGYCSDSISILVEDSNRHDVVTAVSLDINEVEELTKLMTADTSVGSESRLEFTGVVNSALRLLTLLGTTCRDQREYGSISLLCAVLPLAIVSYAGSHCIDIGQIVWSAPLTSLSFASGCNQSGAMLQYSRRTLACLDGFVGSPVWVFGGTDSGTRALLSASIRQLGDLWGPLYGVPTSPGSGVLLALNTDRGILHRSGSADAMSTTNVSDDETLMHWTDTGLFQVAGAPSVRLVIPAATPATLHCAPFSPKSRLLIGHPGTTTTVTASVEATTLAITLDNTRNVTSGLMHQESCGFDMATFEQSNASSLRVIGTHPAYYLPDQYQANFTAGYYVNIGVQKVWRRVPASTHKSALMSHFPMLKGRMEAVLELQVGLEMSACTGNARRVTLREALTLAYPDKEATLTAAYSRDDSAAIAVYLANLQMTGTTLQGELAAFWPFSRGLPEVIQRPSAAWASMLRDSHTAACFAVLSTRCLAYRSIDPVKHRPIQRLCSISRCLPGSPIFQTAIDLTPQAGLRSPLAIHERIQLAEGCLQIRNRESPAQLAFYSRSNIIARRFTRDNQQHHELVATSRASQHTAMVCVMDQPRGLLA